MNNVAPGHLVLASKEQARTWAGLPGFNPVMVNPSPAAAAQRLSAGMTVVLTTDSVPMRLAAKAMAAKEQAPVIEDPANIAGFLPAGPFAEGWQNVTVIGDVHGHFHTLMDLLLAAGFTNVEDPQAISHPEGRLLVFVGDLNDKGEHSLQCLRWAMAAKAAGKALFIKGNHEQKLERCLLDGNRNVRPKLRHTLSAIDAAEDAETLRPRLIQFLQSLPYHLILDQGNLVVTHAAAHAGMEGQTSAAAKEQALYGVVDGFDKKTRYPVRRDWAVEFTGSHTVVHGHVVTEDVRVVTNDAGGRVVSVETGAYEGNLMSALVYDQGKLHWVSVPARPEDKLVLQ